MTETTTQVAPEVIADQVAAGLADMDLPGDTTPVVVTDPPAGEPPVVDPLLTSKPPIVPDPPKLKFNEGWEGLKTKGVKIPENYLKGEFGEGKTEFDALQEVILESNKPAVTTGDPFLDAYNATSPDKREEFVQNYNSIAQVATMDTDAGLKFIYQQQKNEAGERIYTDEDIDQDLTSRSKIAKDREWNDIKSGLKQRQEEALKTPEPTAAEIETAIAAANARRTELMAPILIADEALTEVYGVPYTPEMKAEFKDTFTKMNTINPKTGNAYLYDFLQDDNNLTDVMRAVSLHKNNSLKTYLSNFKEDFKDDTFQKLDVNQKPKSGSGQFAVAQNPDDMV